MVTRTLTEVHVYVEGEATPIIMTNIGKENARKAFEAMGKKVNDVKTVNQLYGCSMEDFIKVSHPISRKNVKEKGENKK